MRYGYVFAWMVGLMVAPHTLTVVGNIAGSHQALFVFWIAVAAMLHSINVRSVAVVSSLHETEPVDETSAIWQVFSISSRWSTTITLSTVLLVTSGFSFNETFLYWFPNFAFAFILLGILMSIHLLAPEVSSKIQISLVAVVLSGLIVLILMGLWKGLNGEPLDNSDRQILWKSPPYAVMLIFVGFDLFSNQRGQSDAQLVRKTLKSGILVVGIVLGLWGVVSFLTVPADRLTDSFIPHNIAARSIGGDTGRLIMGAIVIAGSMAAVNALIAAISRPIAQVTGRRDLRIHRFRNFLYKPGVRIAMAGGGIGLMMAFGFAGEEVIDTYVRAGLVMWLLFYGVTHLTVVAMRSMRGVKANKPFSHWMLPAFGAAVMFFSAGALIWYDPDKIKLLGFSIVVLFITVLVVATNRFLRSIDRDERNGSSHRPFGLSG